jgi:hypothetical protein
MGIGHKLYFFTDQYASGFFLSEQDEMFDWSQTILFHCPVCIGVFFLSEQDGILILSSCPGQLTDLMGHM